jgi:hypothetical protein
VENLGQGASWCVAVPRSVLVLVLAAGLTCRSFGAAMQDGDMFAVTLAEAVALLAAKGKAVARPGRPKKKVGEKGETEQPTKSGKKARDKKGETATKVAIDRPPAKRGRKKKEDVTPADGASPAQDTRSKNIKEGQIEGEPSAGLQDGSPKKRGRRKKEVAVEGLADSAEAPRPVGKSRTTEARAAEKDEVVTATAPAKRGRKKEETAPAEEGGGATAEVARSAGKTQSTKVVVPGGDPGSPPRLRYVKDSVGRWRTPEERAADHAAGVFRRWEIHRGLHRPWLQQQGGQATATLGDETSAGDRTRTIRKRADGVQIVTGALGRTRTAEERAADHAAGVFQEWEVKKGFHHKWLQQQGVPVKKRASKGQDPRVHIVEDLLGRTRTREEKAADHAAGVFRLWEVKQGLHVKWLKQQEGQLGDTAASTAGEGGKGTDKGASGRNGGSEGGAYVAVPKEGRRRGRPPLKSLRPARAEGARGGKPVEGEGRDQEEYAVGAGG